MGRNKLLLILFLLLIIGIVALLFVTERKNIGENFDEQIINRGKNVAKYLQYLIDHPIDYVPYLTARLNYLKDLSMKGLTPKQALCIGNLSGPQSAYGFTRVEPGPFDFPKDHGPHWGIRAGWYFLAANVWLEGESKLEKPISIVYVIKRRAVTPPFMWEDNEPLNHQIVSVYASVTFPEQGIRAGKSVVVGGDKSRVKLSGKPFIWKVDQNYIKGDATKKDLGPLHAFYHDKERNVKFDLKLIPKKPFFLQGDKGCSPCIYGLGYRYYSWPILEVIGTVQAGTKNGSVIGAGWLGHQYGASMEPMGYMDNSLLQAESNIEKALSTTKMLPMWNWFCVQLNNNVQITMAKMPAPDPKKGLGEKGPFPLTLVTKIDKDGSVENISGNIIYTGWGQSPAGNWYATGMEFILFDTHKKVLAQLKLTPTTMNQFNHDGKGAEYFEGGCTVFGSYQGNMITGVAFLEMVGYEPDESIISTLLKNAGASLDPLSLDIFMTPLIDTNLFQDSLLKVIKNS